MAPRFVRTREDFTCERCGAQVRGNGYTNHCPQCLWSKHVDRQPGDRAASCGALMEPVAAVSEGDQTTVIQRCTGCGRVWRNRCAEDDRRDVLLPLFAEPVVDPRPEPGGGTKHPRGATRSRGGRARRQR